VKTRATDEPGVGTMALKIDAIVKRFGPYAALAGVSLEARDGEFLALLGPSGSGKTTLLRVLAGLDRPDAGTVALAGEDFLALSMRERGVGMVFQHYALFRHMSVEANIAFGLSVRPAASRPSRAQIAARVEELLALVRIEGLGRRYPAQLSGGQRQRVALARALAPRPRLLLLDEPFGALDTKVRKQLRAELRLIHDAAGVTTILVTHDQEEAASLADRIALMNGGRIEQIGAPDALDEAPASSFVFEFMGDCNFVDCEFRAGIAYCPGFEAPCFGPQAAPGPGTALFRPSETRLSAEPGALGAPVTIAAVRGRGPTREIDCLDAKAQRYKALVAEGSADRFRPGQAVRLSAPRVVARSRSSI